MRGTRWHAFGLTLVAAGALACAGSPPPQRPGIVSRPLPPPIPDSTGWGVHVLALEGAPDGGLWVGTHGRGLYVLRTDSAIWRHVMPISGDSSGLSWSYINSFTFPRDKSVWYGTVGNGFGRSTDGGRTWKNWTGAQLGKQWVYVVPEGVQSQGDTVYVATADGLRITWDGGATWRCVVGTDSVDPTPPANDGCGERIRALPSKYLLSLAVGIDGIVWVGHLKGISTSSDGGRTWRNLTSADGAPTTRVRALAVTPDSIVWAASEDTIYVDSTETGKKFTKAKINLPGWSGLPGKPRAIAPAPGLLDPSIALSYGLAASDGGGNYRVYYLSTGENYKPVADIWSALWWGPPLWPIGGSAVGLNRVLAGESPVPGTARPTAAPAPEDPRRPWLQRPIRDDEGNPFIDATYRYGATMGGAFQQHQGVEFNNPAGTPVHAIADGTVVFAGPAEQGANTVAILHDARDGDRYVFSTYYHNASLDVRSGQRVRAGDVIARVGSTGRATNEHLHLEVHVAPSADSAAIVDANQRFPQYTVNPELWIAPPDGTGVVAGRVVDANGQPVAGARVYGLVLPYPEETPFSYAETYGDRAHADSAYNENFAVGGVAPGDYLLGVEIGEQKVWRRVRVQAGRVTFVEFSP